MTQLLVALLMIAEGAIAPAVKLEDQSGNPRDVPGPRPTLLIYEDQDGGKENKHAKDVLGQLNAKKENQARVDVLPVADLEKWNWWPAKKYALADIQKTATAKKTTIYIDWKGQVRKSWNLSKGKNHLVLVGTDGKVLFISQGDCSEAQLQDLLAKLATFGVQ
jgi:hypothetical protein